MPRAKKPRTGVVKVTKVGHFPRYTIDQESDNVQQCNWVTRSGNRCRLKAWCGSNCCRYHTQPGEIISVDRRLFSSGGIKPRFKRSGIKLTNKKTKMKKTKEMRKTVFETGKRPQTYYYIEGVPTDIWDTIRKGKKIRVAEEEPSTSKSKIPSPAPSPRLKRLRKRTPSPSPTLVRKIRKSEPSSPTLLKPKAKGKEPMEEEGTSEIPIEIEEEEEGEELRPKRRLKWTEKEILEGRDYIGSQYIFWISCEIRDVAVPKGDFEKSHLFPIETDLRDTRTGKIISPEGNIKRRTDLIRVLNQKTVKPYIGMIALPGHFVAFDLTYLKDDNRIKMAVYDSMSSGTADNVADVLEIFQDISDIPVFVEYTNLGWQSRGCEALNMCGYYAATISAQLEQINKGEIDEFRKPTSDRLFFTRICLNLIGKEVIPEDAANFLNETVYQIILDKYPGGIILELLEKQNKTLYEVYAEFYHRIFS